jgi:hypothetical protein
VLAAALGLAGMLSGAAFGTLLSRWPRRRRVLLSLLVAGPLSALAALAVLLPLQARLPQDALGFDDDYGDGLRPARPGFLVRLAGPWRWRSPPRWRDAFRSGQRTRSSGKNCAKGSVAVAGSGCDDCLQRPRPDFRGRCGHFLRSNARAARSTSCGQIYAVPWSDFSGSSRPSTAGSQDKSPTAATLPCSAPFALVRADRLLRLGLADRRRGLFEADAPRGTIRLAVPAPLAR